MDPNTQIKVEKPDISKLNEVRTAYDANEVIKTALNVNPDVQLARITPSRVMHEAIKVANGNPIAPTLSLFGGLPEATVFQAYLKA